MAKVKASAETKEMARVEVSAETKEKAEALALLFAETPENTIALVVDRYHEVYLGKEGALPEGWELNDDLCLADVEAYFDAYNAEKGISAWAERGRTLRAAVTAGWFKAPAGLSIEDVNKLRPNAATKAKNAIDAFYVRVTTESPNS